MLLSRAILLLLSLTIALVSAWRLRAPRGTFFASLLGLLVLAWSVEFAGLITSQLSIRNIILYNLYAAIEFGILLRLVQQTRPSWRDTLRLVLVVGLVAMAYSMWLHGPNGYLAIEGLLIIGLLCCTVFLGLLIDMARDSEVRLGRTPAFWLFTGALIYFGGIIPILGAWKFIGKLDHKLSQVLYWIVVALAIVRYAFASIACHMERQRLHRAVDG